MHLFLCTYVFCDHTHLHSRQGSKSTCLENQCPLLCEKNTLSYSIVLMFWLLLWNYLLKIHVDSKYKLNKMLKMLKCMQNSWKAVTFQENGPLHSQFLKWNNPFCTLMSDTLHLYWTECTSNYDWFLEGRCHIWQGSQLTLHIFPGMWCPLFGSQVTFTELDVWEFVSLKLFLRKQVTHSGKSVQFPCISCSVMATFAGYWQTWFTFITQDFKN